MNLNLQSNILVICLYAVLCCICIIVAEQENISDVPAEMEALQSFCRWFIESFVCRLRKCGHCNCQIFQIICIYDIPDR